MRSITKISPRSVDLFNVTTQNHHFCHLSHGHNIKHQRLIQLLQELSWIQSLDATKFLHALTIQMGSNPIQQPLVYLHNNIIRGYVSFGGTRLARVLFDKMPQRNAVSYNTIISAYTRDGCVEIALELFSEMRAFGLRPTQFTFGALFSCGLLDVVHGFQLQALVEKFGLLISDAFVGTSMLGIFGRHGMLEEAVKVFESMPRKSLVTWNSMITLFGQHGYVQDSVLMFKDVMGSEMGLSESTLVGVLSSLDEECDRDVGEQLHGVVMKCGVENVVSIANCLVNMYPKCSAIRAAEKMFDAILNKDIVSWNTIIAAMVKSERPKKAIELFLEMCTNSDVLPNATTFASVLNSCKSLDSLLLGESIHAETIKRNLDSDTYVGSVLIDFYAKCDKLLDAHHCFDEIFEKNVVCWNTLMLAYSNQGFSVSLLLLKEMLQSGYLPNEFSFSAVLKPCFALELHQIHCLIIKYGYSRNEYVTSAIIASYSRNGIISDALTVAASNHISHSVAISNVIGGVYNKVGEYCKTQELYSQLEDPDMVSWNILIASCSRNGDYNEVFELFNHMQRTHIRPDNYTYVSLLSVCTKLCNLGLGSSLHSLMIKTDMSRCDTFVCNILIDMYGKCGSLKSSIKIFNEMENRNVISWTAVVSALGLHGYAHDALQKFREMQDEGFVPDKVALVAVLSACRHVGLVKEGMELFEQMKLTYGIEPEMDHYHLAVDLLATNGRLTEAERLISQMPFPPNVLIWRTFLQGCRNNVDQKSLLRCNGVNPEDH